MSDTDRGYCVNCGLAAGTVVRWEQRGCAACDWPVGRPIPPGAFCSICRRHHGPETVHAAE